MLLGSRLHLPSRCRPQIIPNLFPGQSMTRALLLQFSNKLGFNTNLDHVSVGHVILLHASTHFALLPGHDFTATTRHSARRWLQSVRAGHEHVQRAPTWVSS